MEILKLARPLGVHFEIEGFPYDYQPVLKFAYFYYPELALGFLHASFAPPHARPGTAGAAGSLQWHQGRRDPKRVCLFGGYLFCQIVVLSTNPRQGGTLKKNTQKARVTFAEGSSS